jgi:hypothetical protein
LPGGRSEKDFIDAAGSSYCDFITEKIINFRYDKRNNRKEAFHGCYEEAAQSRCGSIDLRGLRLLHKGLSPASD